MSVLMAVIWVLSWLPSLTMTDAEMTGRETPHARPRAGGREPRVRLRHGGRTL